MGIIIAIILSFGLIGGFIASNEVSSNRSPSTYVIEETSQVITPTPTPTTKPTLKPTPKPSPFRFMTECEMEDGTKKEMPITECLEIEKNNHIKNNPTIKPYVSDYKQCQIGDKTHYYKTDDECNKAKEEAMQQERNAKELQASTIALNKASYDLCVSNASSEYQNTIYALGSATDSSAGEAARNKYEKTRLECSNTYQPRE